jgi:16S rRNA (cytosine1402-N4)-methyltransferase
LVLDAGVSSHQLDTARRGFSFQQDGPLDMRMGDSGPTAAEVIDALPEGELSLILRNYGEVRGARRLAARIKEARRQGELETTRQLAALCGKPHPRKKVHPATLVFQALRIQVNDELGGLEEIIGDLGRILKPGGRCAIISFHSLEDRIVKHGMRLLERGPQQDPNAMFMAPGPAYQPVIKTLGGLIRPSEQEIEVNPRSRSARLRVAKRVASPQEAS